jgi:hypothetical protein
VTGKRDVNTMRGGGIMEAAPYNDTSLLEAPYNGTSMLLGMVFSIFLIGDAPKV